MNPRNRAFLECVAVVLAAATAGLTGCLGGVDGDPEAGPHDFISDNPRGGNSPGEDAEGGSTGSGGAGNPTDPGTEDPERAITEADIIQVHEGKLYALSQYSGLSVIDISVPDQLTLLGRYNGTSGVPFEMYLRDGVVYAMFSSWGQYVWDAATSSYQWAQTSHIEALDVTNPATIAPIGSFDVPGSISDSRVVGDVLYAVTFEDGYCWDCNPEPSTTITSIHIADPAAISVVDQLSFADNDPWGYGWRRSVAATPERMYVAGVEWDGSGEGHSTIQVVDISDPSGQLVLGDSIEAAGQIESRWQMDEHQGVLRVISQPGVWWSDAMPAVQTFTVVSSQELTPLGYTELQLPQPETLRSVRFDGDRAYAITFEQVDPLFTIDLTNPAQPAQVGELVMPGWVYHMEPRGDRLLALGFDNTNPEGSLNVSLFNVADMTQPTMIERVSFGGDWGGFAEDQDRIHKAFTILDQLGLLLVPYSGWSWDNDTCGDYRSGIQLVDFTTDSLTKRGVAPARGQARRAFVHDDGRMFAVSDEEVRTFSIANRDAPQLVTSQTLANMSNQAAQVGDVVVRLSADWWTNAARIEVVPAASPEQPDPIGQLDLSSVAGQGSCYGWGVYGARLFANGQHVYLVWPSDAGDSMRVISVDLTDPASPSLGGELTLPLSGYDLWGYYGPVVTAGDAIVKAGDALVFRRTDQDYYYYDGSDPTAQLHDAWLEVVDLRTPGQPVHSATLPLPQAAGHTPLQVEGSEVLLSHWVPLPQDSSKARFYLDRINVSNPAAPVARPPVNVPGSLLAYDASVNRMLSVDYQRFELLGIDSMTCWSTYGWDAQFEPNDPDNWEGEGTCTVTMRYFKLAQVQGNLASLTQTIPIEIGTGLWSPMIGEDRVFAMAQNGGWYEDGGPYWASSKLYVVGGIRDGALQVEQVTGEELGYVYPVAASGARLIAGGWGPPGIWTLDATDLDDLAFEQKAELRGYISHVAVEGDQALCSLGPYGLASVDIGD